MNLMQGSRHSKPPSLRMNNGPWPSDTIVIAIPAVSNSIVSAGVAPPENRPSGWRFRYGGYAAVGPRSVMAEAAAEIVAVKPAAEKERAAEAEVEEGECGRRIHRHRWRRVI